MRIQQVIIERKSLIIPTSIVDPFPKKWQLQRARVTFLQRTTTNVAFIMKG